MSDGRSDSAMKPSSPKSDTAASKPGKGQRFSYASVGTWVDAR